MTPTGKRSFYSLFNPFQIVRDVFFREAQRSTCAITGEPLTSNLTHHCRARDAPQSCLTSSTVYFARLRSSVGLVSGCFDTFSSILVSRANITTSFNLPI